MVSNTIEIRKLLDAEQQRLLTVVWDYYVHNGEWMPDRALRREFESIATARSLADQLGGSIVFIADRYDFQEYWLTELGVFLSENGEQYERLVANYLGFVYQKCYEEPKRTSINSKEVAEVLHLTGDEVIMLGRLLRIETHFANGGSFPIDHADQWESKIPPTIQDRPSDMLDYVQQKVSANYDPQLPVEALKRHSYLVSKVDKEQVKNSVGLKRTQNQSSARTESAPIKQVFISYAHEDRDFAENLAQKLDKEGFRCWIDNDRLRAGTKWREEIDNAIRQSFALIVVVSPESEKSRYVSYEWAFAFGRGIGVVPVLLKPTKTSGNHLRQLQHIDFTEKTRPWNELFQRLRELEGNPISHSNPPHQEKISKDDILLWFDKNAQEILSNAMPLTYSGDVWGENGTGFPISSGKIKRIKVGQKEWNRPVVDKKRHVVGYVEIYCNADCVVELPEDEYSYPPKTGLATGTLQCYVIARLTISSISDLIREINSYKHHISPQSIVSNPSYFWVVCPDDSYAQLLGQQEIGFIKFPIEDLPQTS